MYHRWRYIQITKLSETIHSAPVLDIMNEEIRDNQEGELSILKVDCIKSDVTAQRRQMS